MITKHETKVDMMGRPKPVWRKKRDENGKYVVAPRQKQEFKAECDINNIMKKYVKTGQLFHLAKGNPKYGEFADALTFQESLNLVNFAQEQFEALPAHVREQFGNDPIQFLKAAELQENQELFISLGLATRKELRDAPDAVPSEKQGEAAKTPTPKKSKVDGKSAAAGETPE